MRILFLLFALLFAAGPAAGCFGPKLYIGTGGSVEEDLLYAVVSLYLKEKTGTETVRVPLEGKPPLAEIAAQRVDLAFVPAVSPEAPAPLLAIPGWPPLVSGRRPLEDLQFTTVSPAIEKLNRLLTPPLLQGARERLAAGASPAAAARQLLTGKGWI